MRDCMIEMSMAVLNAALHPSCYFEAASGECPYEDFSTCGIRSPDSGGRCLTGRMCIPCSGSESSPRSGMWSALRGECAREA